ncbi:MAG: UbiA family prenyltransferase [Candidatus Krumholzibacteriia bacterium]
MLRLFDFVFVLRPLILIPAWSFYLIGAAQAEVPRSGTAAGLPSPSVFVALTTILTTAYLLNQVFDRESDEKNGKCFYLSRGIFHARTLVIMALLSFLVASTAFRHVEGIHRGLLLGALVLSLFYSLPPLRLCARPFADMLANAAGYGGLAFALGYGASRPALAVVTAASPWALLVAATFLHTAILDVPGDRDSGKISTAVFLGAGTASWLAAFLHAAAVVTAILTRNTAALWVTGALLPAAAYAVVRRDGRASSIVVQASTGVVAVAAAVFWPAYLLLIVPVVVLSRFYYKRRFGIIYPGLRNTSG